MRLAQISDHDVALQSDGKIVSVGRGVEGSATRMLVVRHTTIGALDIGFDGDGKGTVLIGSGAEAHRVQVLSDGKMLLGGEIYNGSEWNLALARLNTDAGLSQLRIGLVHFTPTGALDTSAVAVNWRQPSAQIVVLPRP